MAKAHVTYTVEHGKKVAGLKPKMRELHNAGKKVMEIARELGVSHTVVGKTVGTAKPTKWYTRIRDFHRGSNVKKRLNGIKLTFTETDFKNKVGPNPVSVLTGDPIKDIEDFSSWEMAHYPIPRARGGSSTLGNVNIMTPRENRLAGDLLLEEIDTMTAKIQRYAFKRTLIDFGDERRWILENAKRFGLIVNTTPTWG